VGIAAKRHKKRKRNLDRWVKPNKVNHSAGQPSMKGRKKEDGAGMPIPLSAEIRCPSAGKHRNLLICPFVPITVSGGFERAPG
jgi:hypothetical protein